MVLIVVLFSASILLLYNRDVDVHHFSEQRSPDGRYSLNVDVGNPPLPFGSHSVIITIKSESDEPILEGKFGLSNDGANIYSNNIEAHWIDIDSAEVCLKGDEQSDALVSIKVLSRTMLEKNKKC